MQSNRRWPGFDKLDARLAEVSYVAGDRFTIADILACTLDFGKVVGLRTTPNNEFAGLAWAGEHPSQRPGLILTSEHPRSPR